MQLLRSMQDHLTPTVSNAYRPHLLSRSWLMFFLILSLAVEGFLVSSLVAQQSNGVFLSLMTAPQSESASLSLSQILQTIGRQTVRIFSDEQVVNTVLGGVAGLLLILVALAFFFHIDIQSPELLAGGATVAAIALLCLAANIHIFSNAYISDDGGQTAGGALPISSQ